jgi:hypothetical protein
LSVIHCVERREEKEKEKEKERESDISVLLLRSHNSKRVFPTPTPTHMLCGPLLLRPSYGLVCHLSLYHTKKSATDEW